MADVFDFTEEKFLRAINAAMEFFIVEYSVRENAIHIGTLKNVLRNNHKNICNDVPKDYLPVGIFKSREDADRVEMHFYTNVVPEAQLMSDSQRWRHVADCFTSELNALVLKAEATEK
jgi:hypothetical protein